MSRIMITGAEGQLGRHLAHAPWPGGARLFAFGARDLDVTSSTAVRAAFSHAGPDIVINAAAFTAVDAAEADPERAEAVNATAVEYLVHETDRVGGAFVQISTDYVFDGAQDGWYTEEDAPNPLNVYGRSKLGGEEHAAAGACALVLRSSWLFGRRGTNFVRSIRRLARERHEIEVVQDQRGCPTSAADLSEAIVAILRVDPRPRGLLHAAAPDDASWWELARATIALMRPRPEIDVRPVGSEAYGAAARRPANSRLSSELLAERYGVRLRPWHDALAGISDELNDAEVIS